MRKLDKDSAGLRDGSIDLETGVVDAAIGPEIRTQALFVDRYIVAVRAGHPLARGNVSPQRYAEARHVLVERRGLQAEQADKALGALGLSRNAVVEVDGFAAALAMARASELVATVPERHTAGLREGMADVAMPLALGEFTISLLWHPRMDGDPAHRWLRGCVRHACGGVGHSAAEI